MISQEDLMVISNSKLNELVESIPEYFYDYFGLLEISCRDHYMTVEEAQRTLDDQKAEYDPEQDPDNEVTQILDTPAESYADWINILTEAECRRMEGRM